MKWISILFSIWLLFCVWRTSELQRFSSNADFLKMGMQTVEKFKIDCVQLYDGVCSWMKSLDGDIQSSEKSRCPSESSPLYFSAEEHELLNCLELLCEMERKIDHSELQWLETRWHHENLRSLDSKFKSAKSRNQNITWLARGFSEPEPSRRHFSQSQQNLRIAELATNRDHSSLIRLIRECRQGIRKRKSLIQQELRQEVMDYLETENRENSKIL